MNNFIDCVFCSWDYHFLSYVQYVIGTVGIPQMDFQYVALVCLQSFRTKFALCCMWYRCFANRDKLPPPSMWNSQCR